MNDVMHIEMLARAAPRNATSVFITREDSRPLLRRQRMLRTSIWFIDIAHDRRVARERRDLGVIELHSVCEPASIGGDPHLRWCTTALL
jgi:hypothetical protein